MGARAPPTHSEADNRSQKNDQRINHKTDPYKNDQRIDHRRMIRESITEERSEDRSQKNDQRIDHKTDQRRPIHQYKNDQRLDPYKNDQNNKLEKLLYF